MKATLIVPYFGTLPNYFQLFLDSCVVNEGYQWLIITDDDRAFRCPENVQVLRMTFAECKEYVQKKFDFPIALDAPFKLCDFRCAYGYIFQEFLQESDWWGHCDLDQIFGNLNHFITPEMLENFDKIFCLGHLTLYRNTGDNNLMFTQKLNGKERYREVFTTPVGCGFDEWMPGSINEIYQQGNKRVHWENLGADINPYKTAFAVTYYDLQDKVYKNRRNRNSVFYWDNGDLYQMFKENGQMKKVEYPYIHLQKRAMKDKRKASGERNFYIVPNSFVDGRFSVDRLLRRAFIWRIVNYQYFLVKKSSFLARCKSKNWKRVNVFKK